MRLLPIGKSTHDKVFNKLKRGDKDGALNAYCNSVSWYAFLERCGISIFPEWCPHEVKLFSKSIQEYENGDWHEYYFCIRYDWLTDEIKSETMPGSPEGNPIMRKRVGFKSPISTVKNYPIAEKFAPWQLPGQRFLENFKDSQP